MRTLITPRLICHRSISHTRLVPLLVPPSRPSSMRLVSIISSLVSYPISSSVIATRRPRLIPIISYRYHPATTFDPPQPANADKNELNKTARSHQPRSLSSPSQPKHGKQDATAANAPHEPPPATPKRKNETRGWAKSEARNETGKRFEGRDERRGERRNEAKNETRSEAKNGPKTIHNTDTKNHKKNTPRPHATKMKK